MLLEATMGADDELEVWWHTKSKFDSDCILLVLLLAKNCS